MFKVYRLLDNRVLDSKNNSIIPTLLKHSLNLSIIPDIYLTRSKPNSLNHLNEIVLSSQTQDMIKELSVSKLRILHVNYWPHSLANQLEGSYILPISSQEKAFFYADNTFVFFQRLISEDIDLIRNYLKRYQIELPDKIKELPLTDLPNGSFMEVLKSFFSRDAILSNARSPFVKKLKSYRYSLILKAALITLICIFASTLIGQYSNRQQRLQEINRINSILLPLTPDQRKTAYQFKYFQEAKKDQHAVSFKFAYTIIRQWLNHLVISSIDWKPESTTYTLTFNPDFLEKIDTFIDWLDVHHPTVKVIDKESRKGNLKIIVMP